MDTNPTNVESKLVSAWPPERRRNVRILLAVSGGADSVALLRAMQRLTDRPDRVHVAHFNHCWRGSESEADANFVRQLCHQYDLPFHLGTASSAASLVERSTLPSVFHADRNTASDVRAASSEEKARRERYEFLRQTAHRFGARYVVTAHNLDDRIETMLHNLCRGTGLRGVSSLTRIRDLDQDLVLIRPLLDCSRQEIIAYLQSLSQDYRRDSSNTDTSYKRNALRKNVIPVLEQIYDQSLKHRLLSFIELAEDHNQCLRLLAENWLHQQQAIGGGFTIPAVTGNPSANQRSSFTFQILPLEQWPWPVIQRGLTLVWEHLGWPQSSMSRDHWEILKDYYQHLQMQGEDNPSSTSQARTQAEITSGQNTTSQTSEPSQITPCSENRPADNGKSLSRTTFPAEQINNRRLMRSNPDPAAKWQNLAHLPGAILCQRSQSWLRVIREP